MSYALLKKNEAKKEFSWNHGNNILKVSTFPADIYLLKVNNGNTRTRCEICSK